MRRELEILEQIDDFLDGKISITVLRENLKDCKDLDAQIESQQMLRNVMGKDAFLSDSQKALSKHKLYTALKLPSLIVLIALGVVAAFLVYSYIDVEKEVSIAYEPRFELVTATADSLIESQVFELNNSKDTVIVSKSGMILSISQHTFNTVNNSNYTIELKEAITPVDIIKGGLSTMAGSVVLETGGMFKISAYQGQEELVLNADQSIEFLVPTTSKIPGMRLYTGEVTSDAEINWVNPMDISNPLTSSDVCALNFYPKEYQNYITKNGWRSKGKAWTDSVYFDLSKITIADKTITGKDTSYQYIIKEGINPNLIKAFWKEEFNNTLLATLEFEKRMPLIHKTGDNKILNLYTSNLDKNLYEIDSMAKLITSKKHKKAFHYLMQLREGKVAKPKSKSELALLNRAIKASRKNARSLKTSNNISYYHGRLVNSNLSSIWYNLDIPYAVRKQLIVEDEIAYQRLIKNLEHEQNNSAAVENVLTNKARKNIEIEIKNVHQFKAKHCFAYILRKNAHSFEKISLRHNQLVIEHKQLENYELAIIGLKDGRQWLYVPKVIKNGTIELAQESKEDFAAKIERIASSNRFKQELFNSVSNYSNVNDGPKLGEESSRLTLAKAIYKVEVDTIFNKKDINSYQRNRFTIQTIDFDPRRKKAPSVPTKLSRKINQLKVFFNTTEYEVNLKTKNLFLVEVFDAEGRNVLENMFEAESRKTDYETRQQNIAIFWTLKDNKKLEKGTYTAKLFYGDKLISSKSFKVY